MKAVKYETIEAYRTQTRSFEALRVYIDMDFDGLRESIEQMLAGSQCPVDISAFRNDMSNIKTRDDVLTLLVHLGYLVYDAGEKTVRIPNRENRQEFIAAVDNGKNDRNKELAKLIQTYGRYLR
jgi:hypothetical protein